MAEDPLARPVHRESRLDQRRQLPGDVSVHPVVARPRFLRGIDVEPGAAAKIVAVMLAWKVRPARAGIRRDDDQAMLGGMALRARLLGEIGPGAGQAGQPVQHRDRAVRRLRRLIDRELHRALRGARVVPVDALNAAEAAMLLQRGQVFGHGCPDEVDASEAVLRALSRSPRCGSTCRVHQVERVVDLLERHGVGDQIVDVDLAVHVPVDDLGHVGAATRAAERACRATPGR